MMNDYSNPNATRPWQHVLALCHGYLLLGYWLVRDPLASCSAWNFGPLETDVVPVHEILKMFEQSWRLPKKLEVRKSELHEAPNLALNSELARKQMNWAPVWELDQAVEATARWYEAFSCDTNSAEKITRAQVEAYRSALLEEYSDA